MRKKIVAGNWKMNLNLDEGVHLANQINDLFQKEIKQDVTGILCAPYIMLSSVHKVLESSANNLHLGSQNCSEHESGAYTGEISTTMLQSVGVSHIILGHSERREYQKESADLLTKKVSKVINSGLTPIFCCGEGLEIRESGTQNQFVANQIQESLYHLSKEEILKVIIAYEPIWAIGTGKTASAKQAQEMHANIRQSLSSQYGQEIAEQISILYGGSCKPSNAKEIFEGQDVDGGLIGGAALQARDFIDILKSF